MTTTISERRRLRRFSQFIGWVGLIACIVLIAAILLGRGWISGRVGETFATIDDVLDRGTVVVNVATGRLEERLADIDTFVADASTVGENLTLPPALAARAATIVDRYGDIRDEFVAVRERIAAAYQTIQQLARLLPFVELPTGPSDALTRLDERVASFDAAISGLRTEAGATRARAVAAATAVRGVVDGIRGVTERIDTGIAEVRLRVDRANDNIDNVLWLVTIVLLIVVGYAAFLNGLIIFLARRLGPRPPSAVEPAVVATPEAPAG
jgi:hypothetical protein